MKKRNSKVLSILIPSAGIASLATIVIPMVCLTTNHVHITRKTEERTKQPTIDEIQDIKFTYTLTDENIDLLNLHCTWGYTISSMRNCAISNMKFQSVDPTTFEVHLSLVGIKDHQVKLGDSISFDFHFSYWDDDKIVWKQDILNNYIKVSEEAHD